LSFARPQLESSVDETVDVQALLVERLRRGERAAVAEVYDGHQGALRAFARKLTGDAHVAEDLVHDVFVALPSAVKRFREDAALRTFLISIAVNHARKHVRAASRRRSAMERYAREPEGGGIGGSPEGDAARKQLAGALSRALDKLPLDQRVAFVLCEVEQRTSREAAEVVDAPEETVRTRLFHARKKLRAILEKEGIR
jgi:RNA polymerase sigma-70 factor, ECF subfamily